MAELFLVAVPPVRHFAVLSLPGLRYPTSFRNMEDLHPLKSFLQMQLASDASAVLHLPYVLDALSPEHFQPSQHTQKWCTRVNSLLHSRESSARWSGLCLALQTSIHSRVLMLEYAAAYVGVALPLLSVCVPPL